MKRLALLLMLVTGLSCSSTDKRVVYRCPMECEGKKNYDKPGNCPVCQMDLEAVK